MDSTIAERTWELYYNYEHGRQFILRIPKEIAEEAGLTTENQIKFKLTKPSPDSNEKPKLEISVL